MSAFIAPWTRLARGHKKPLRFPTSVLVAFVGMTFLCAQLANPQVRVDIPAQHVVGLILIPLLGTYLYRFGSSDYIRTIGHAALMASSWAWVMFFGSLATTLAVACAFPLQDDLLSAVEGLTATQEFARATTLPIHSWLGAVYTSLGPQIQVLMLYFTVWDPNPAALRSTTRIVAITTLLGLVIHIGFPAMGPHVYYDQVGPPPSHLDAFVALRSGNASVVPLNGYVSAPSFHIVLMLVLLRLWGQVRGPLRWCGYLVNIPMPLATWVMGDHYLTDMLAGALVYLIAVKLCSRSR